MLFLDVVGGNGVKLLLFIEVENSLLFVGRVYFIHLFLKLPDHVGRVYIFLLMRRLSLELLSRNEGLLFVYFLFQLEVFFFEEEFFCALEIVVFVEVGDFGGFPAFGGVGFIVEEGPVAFPVGLVDLLYSTNFVFEKGHILDVDIDFDALGFVDGKFAFDVVLKILLVDFGRVLLSFDEIGFPAFLEVSEVVGLDVDFGLALFDVLVGIFGFGFELFVDGCDDFFILFFLGYLRLFSLASRHQLAGHRIVLDDRIYPYVLPFELFLGSIHIHLNLNIMAVFLKINC